jgi:hypothetical protein
MKNHFSILEIPIQMLAVSMIPEIKNMTTFCLILEAIDNSLLNLSPRTRKKKCSLNLIENR